MSSILTYGTISPSNDNALEERPKRKRRTFRKPTERTKKHLHDSGVQNPCTDERPRREYIYFVRSRGSGNIKIGWTRNLWKRLHHIHAHSGDGIDLLIHIIGEPGQNLLAEEAKLHELFDEARLHHEWFEPHPTLVALIDHLRSGVEDLGHYDAMQVMFVADPEDVGNL